MENINTGVERSQNVIISVKNALDNVFSVIPITKREGLILKTICSSESLGKTITSTELSNILCVSKPAVSQFLTSLENNGYITRKTSKDDRRKTYICSTEKARNEIKNFEEYINRIFIIIKERLGIEKFDYMLSLLEETTEIIKYITENSNLFLSSEE